jgi:hypothetical protein
MKNITTLNVLQLDDWNFKVTGFKVKTGLQAGKPLGDSVAGLTHFTGLDRLTNLYTQLTGLDCGCKTRQEKLNMLVPNFAVSPKLA